MCDGFIAIRVTELSVPPRFPSSSVRGVCRCRSLAWYIRQTPFGMRCETVARQAMTPLRLYASTQSLSGTPSASASSRASHSTAPPRNRVSMCRLSWYSEWIDHFECGVR